MDSQIILVGWLVCGLFFVSLLNMLCLVVLLKNLAWLWVRSREDRVEEAEYISKKVVEKLVGSREGV